MNKNKIDIEPALKLKYKYMIQRTLDLDSINLQHGDSYLNSKQARLDYIERMKVKYPNDVKLIEKIANDNR